MSTLTSTTASSGLAKPSSRPGKTKVIKFKLSSTLLSRFPSSTPASSSTASAPILSELSTAAEELSPQANAPDSNAAESTPTIVAPNGLLAPPASTSGKKKGVPGPKPNLKRTNSQLAADGVPKPRGKPGPKKKARVGENGVTLNGAAAPAAPKLGPKANQGAINACLRALDRTGKPCRRWGKSGFKVKSFTGITWDTRAWSANKKVVTEFAGDVKSDTSSSAENKPMQESSALASAKSHNSGADSGTMILTADMTSSPAPAAVVNPV